MDQLILVGLAGFAASFVDGALGMGFGPTSSSILLATNLTPGAASTTVNLAKVATGLAAAVSHIRFKNIDRRLVLALALPGVVGALVGGTVLANVEGRSVRPLLAGMLILIALRILARFSQIPVLPPPSPVPGGGSLPPADTGAAAPTLGVVGAGFAGGVTNALVGAWGPIVTPYLLHRGVSPRISVGSVNTAELAVASMSAGTLIAALGTGKLNLPMLGAMLIGGFLAAPIAAWAVRHVPARGMGLGVAGLLLITNVVELATWADLGGGRWVLYASVPGAVTLAATAPRWRERARKSVSPSP